MTRQLITAEWLKSVGFRWHQLDRQPTPHWLLWLGDATGDRVTSFEDLGIELAAWTHDEEWLCWLRADTSARYHRFIHIRHLTTCDEVIALVVALTGQPWNPDNHYGGSVYRPEQMAKIRADRERLDHQIRERNAKWAEVEKDDSRGRALPEHMEAQAKGIAPRSLTPPT
jgi:hypothetical protein